MPSKFLIQLDVLYKNKYLDFSLYLDKPNDLIQKEFIENGLFQQKLYDWSFENIKSGWLIYDIGANIFEFTEVFARLSGVDGEVHSFEPQKDLFDNYIVSQKNNDYSSAAKINLYNFGLHDVNSEITFYKNVNNVGASSVSKDFVKYVQENVPEHFAIFNDSEKITVRKASDVELPKKIPDLIKIDIEGNEYNAWKGFPDNLKQAKNIIIELGAYSEKELLVELFSYNRKAYYLNGEIAATKIKELEKKLIKSNRQFDLVFK